MSGEAPAPMYCAHMTGDGCELSNCEEHECHLDDREDVEIRMPDPNTEHGLRVQLATALRERDLAVHVADGKSAELMEALADATTLRADVKRLTEALASPLAFRDAEWAAALGLTDMCKPACLQEDSGCPSGMKLRAALATGGDRG